MPQYERIYKTRELRPEEAAFEACNLRDSRVLVPFTDGLNFGDLPENAIVVGHYRAGDLVAVCGLVPLSDAAGTSTGRRLLGLLKDRYSAPFWLQGFLVKDSLQTDVLVVRFFSELFQLLDQKEIFRYLIVSPMHLEPTFLRIGFRRLNPHWDPGEGEQRALLIFNSPNSK